MNASIETMSESHTDTARYARCIKASKKEPWEIDRDVLRGRAFDYSATSSCRTGFQRSTSSRS